MYNILDVSALFVECFSPITAKSGRDLIPVMVHGRNISGQEFGGMYCILLTVRSVVVSAGLLRIFGREVAELPLVATSKEFQGKGYFLALFSRVEKLLYSLNVENLVLPAAERAKSMWVNRLGFKDMSPERLSVYTRELQLTEFNGTVMLEKKKREENRAVLKMRDDPEFSLLEAPLLYYDFGGIGKMVDTRAKASKQRNKGKHEAAEGLPWGHGASLAQSTRENSVDCPSAQQFVTTEQLGEALKQLGISLSLCEGSNRGQHQDTPLDTNKLGADTLRRMRTPCKAGMLGELSKLNKPHEKPKSVSLPPVPPLLSTRPRAGGTNGMRNKKNPPTLVTQKQEAPRKEFLCRLGPREGL
ncbi:hypothetical protein Cgig2_022536 [Carnegiea gigantea]|uniref:Increased DNA methylation 1 C-terminal domain-containing protein n=1 Tax=Carnegiea gigantea TaxID=171969 RepID=A0A9Q1JKE5_9CARY|nr:hypothetical protein Cgig2_022536 [Carnegiea gigantea]